jgi:hypothetical protein
MGTLTSTLIILWIIAIPACLLLIVTTLVLTREYQNPGPRLPEMRSPPIANNPTGSPADQS